MGNHTPQEWVADGCTVYALNVEGTNRFVSFVNGGWATNGRLRTDQEELEANATLMSAAPELLDALIECDKLFRILGHIAAADEPCDGSVGWKIRAAIAKATGESP